VDLTLPSGWVFSELYGENIATRVNTTFENGSQSVSLFSTFEEKTVTKILEVAKLIIQNNEEREEKERLLHVKKMELEKLFIESNLQDLKEMSFTKNNILNKSILNDKEIPKVLQGVVTETSEKRPTGDRKTKK
tara:strand:+ start:155 stop:556 length:402 start_codon:yes stop_codon:yes gene_type:complete